MATRPRKGTTGKNTGGTTRGAIKRAVNRGASLKKIGAATGRDDSTIGSILGGRIKNPPKGLAGQINKVGGTKGQKPASKPKGSKATAAFKKHRK